MPPVRDLLALILGCLHGAVWAGYMAGLVVRGTPPGELDWAILPTGIGALLGTLALTERVYQPRHRAPQEE